MIPPNPAIEVALSLEDNERHAFSVFGDSWCENLDVDDGETVDTGERDVTCPACVAELEAAGE